MIDKITKVGLSYHHIKFGDVEMPKLFAKQGENARAFQFTISDLRGVVPDLTNLEMAMNIEIRQYRDIVKATPLSLEDDTGVFLIEFPNIALYGNGTYNLVLSEKLENEATKNVYTKNGDIVIQRNSIFDNELGGNTLFDLEEFKESLARQKEYLKQMQMHERNSNEYKELADKYAKASKESADLSLKIQGEMQTVFNSENERKENENIRIAQELERVNEEIKRVNKENERIEVESKRVSDELERINSEDIRKENETKRIAAEDIRKENEKSRVSNHTAMQESIRRWSLLMQDWIAAEESRVLSESTRKDLFNQMKKEFDEMMDLLGDNPVGNLTQEFQELKGTIAKHFKSIVLEGDNLIAIREDLTELTIPLDLTKYATVKQLEELSSLLNTTKTQLQMKIGNKADKDHLHNTDNVYYISQDMPLTSVIGDLYDKKADIQDLKDLKIASEEMEEKIIKKADKEHKHYATDIPMSTSSTQSVASRITSIESDVSKKADASTVNQSYQNAIFDKGKLQLIKHNDVITELNIGENIDIDYSDSQPNITLAKTGNIVVLNILEETEITNSVIATTIPYKYRPRSATTVSVAYHNNSTGMVFYTFKIWGGGEITCTFTTINEEGHVVTNRKDGTIKENLSLSYMV